jgi:hypothetical protein
MTGLFVGFVSGKLFILFVGDSDGETATAAVVECVGDPDGKMVTAAVVVCVDNADGDSVFSTGFEADVGALDGDMVITGVDVGEGVKCVVGNGVVVG